MTKWSLYRTTSGINSKPHLIELDRPLVVTVNHQVLPVMALEIVVLVLLG